MNGNALANSSDILTDVKCILNRRVNLLVIFFSNKWLQIFNLRQPIHEIGVL